MFSLIGHVLMTLAACGTVAVGWSAWRSQFDRARGMTLIVACLLGFAMLNLILAFVVSDFSLTTVFNHSHTAKPLFFRIAGAWGNHEGSMLMWGLFSALYMALFAAQSRRLPQPLVRGTLIFAAVALLGVILFTGTVSSPFTAVEGSIPMEGRDLNPLLQDIGLVIHPPALYLGYTALLIPWALACSALITRTEAKDWARAVKPWAFLSLACLTSGIMLGSWWAYRELGWGGWWFWDPVENISVIPWLLGVALAHSTLSIERQGQLVGWSLAMAILAYGSTLLGTFLVRSGALVSVHAFASDPGRGIAIWTYMLVLIGGALILLALRMPPSEERQDSWLSRATMMRLQNVLIAAMAGTVLMGTIYPPVLQALGQAPVAVGTPYYTATVVPVAVATVLLMSVATSLSWKSGVIGAHKRLIGVALASVVVISLIGVLLGWGVVTAIAAGAGAGAVIMGFRKHPERVGKSGWATLISHAGIGVFAVAAALNVAFDIEADREVPIGESFVVEDYEIALEEVREIRGPNWVGAEARVLINGARELTPQYRFYPVREIPTTEAAIHTNLLRDLRVTLNLVDGGAGEEAVWALRFHRKPAMVWLWIATLIISSGLALSAVNAFRRS